MPVIASGFTLGHAQKDGRRYVTERHTLDIGEVVVREYGPVVEIDYAAVAAQKAAQIDQAEADTMLIEAHESEASAAREKVAAILAAAEKNGEISKEELGLAGHALAEVKGG